MGIDISSPPRVDVIPWFEASLSNSAIPISFYQFSLQYINTSTFILSKKKKKKQSLIDRERLKIDDDTCWRAAPYSCVLFSLLRKARKMN